MNNKTLLIVFLALLGLYLLSKTFGGKQERSFKSELIKVDTAAVNKILLYPQADDRAEITLLRSGNYWTISNGERTEPAMNNVVQSVLNDLSLIKATRVAAKSKEKWVDYELDEAGSKSRLKIYENDQLVGDFSIGRFSFDQNTRTATSFIRLEEGETVYAVEGLLSMNLGKSFVAFRDRTIVKLDPKSITSIQFNYLDDSQAHYQLINQQWQLDGQGAVDSTKVANYLSGLANLNGLDFSDAFNPVNAIDSLETVELNGPSLQMPIKVDCYRVKDQQKPYVFHSSLNHKAYIRGNDANIYSKLFKNKTAFLLDQ